MPIWAFPKGRSKYENYGGDVVTCQVCQGYMSDLGVIREDMDGDPIRICDDCWVDIMDARGKKWQRSQR